jgi:hypothetical protein
MLSMDSNNKVNRDMNDILSNNNSNNNTTTNNNNNNSNNTNIKLNTTITTLITLSIWPMSFIIGNSYSFNIVNIIIYIR